MYKYNVYYVFLGYPSPFSSLIYFVGFYFEIGFWEIIFLTIYETLFLFD